MQAISYRAPLQMDVCYQIEGGAVQRFTRRFGLLPIMVKSEVCYLHSLDRWAVPLGALQHGAVQSHVVVTHLGSCDCSRNVVRPVFHSVSLRTHCVTTREGLVVKGEESTEMGGYFICNGIERIIRMITLQRRHYIMALRRGAYRKRGANYTANATLLRCSSD
jgi:DNA-directed RNA polymerase beta subunit